MPVADAAFDAIADAFYCFVWFDSVVIVVPTGVRRCCQCDTDTMDQDALPALGRLKYERTATALTRQLGTPLVKHFTNMLAVFCARLIWLTHQSLDRSASGGVHSHNDDAQRRRSRRRRGPGMSAVICRCVRSYILIFVVRYRRRRGRASTCTHTHTHTRCLAVGDAGACDRGDRRRPQRLVVDQHRPRNNSVPLGDKSTSVFECVLICIA